MVCIGRQRSVNILGVNLLYFVPVAAFVDNILSSIMHRIGDSGIASAGLVRLVGL